MKKLIATKEGKADFLKHYRYILCDARIKRSMTASLGMSLISKGKIIPIVLNEVPIETVVRNIRVLLKSYLVRINGACMYVVIAQFSSV